MFILTLLFSILFVLSKSIIKDVSGNKKTKNYTSNCSLLDCEKYGSQKRREISQRLNNEIYFST
ncbi:hypothetical protein HMPREF3249_01800 [Streptococcus sp. HMSC36C04]|nr:hypothetical protein HMPREF3249_01800 [Streptococcus sp. HMSC36C04]